MNWKRYWISAAAVLLGAKGLVAALFFGVLFDSVYDQALPCARAEGSEVYAAGLICMIAWSLAFANLRQRISNKDAGRNQIGLIAGSFTSSHDQGFYGY